VTLGHVDFLDGIDHRVVTVVFFAVITGVGEIAFRVGRQIAVPTDDIARSQIGTTQAALLGLSWLLLGFTFGMAQQRYDARRIMHVNEANAIGTAYLRADVLP